MDTVFSPHLCYLIQSADGRRLYNGYTTDMTRRLRQHNGELVGGARATQGRGPWRLIALVSAYDSETWTQREALSLEWHIRYPTNRRPRPAALYRTAEDRVIGIAQAMAHPRFANAQFHIRLWIAQSPRIDAAFADTPHTVEYMLPLATATRPASSAVEYLQSATAFMRPPASSAAALSCKEAEAPEHDE